MFPAGSTGRPMSGKDRIGPVSCVRTSRSEGIGMLLRDAISSDGETLKDDKASLEYLKEVMGDSAVCLRVGVVVSWDLGVIIASLGNVFDASMGVGVLRVATSSFEQFAQDGLQVDVRQATRKQKRQGMHNMLHAHQWHGATCLVSVPIWDHGSELLPSPGGKPAGLLTVGYTLPLDDLARTQNIMAALAEKIGDGFNGVTQALIHDVRSHFLAPPVGKLSIADDSLDTTQHSGASGDPPAGPGTPPAAGSPRLLPSLGPHAPETPGSAPSATTAITSLSAARLSLTGDSVASAEEMTDQDAVKRSVLSAEWLLPEAQPTDVGTVQRGPALKLSSRALKAPQQSRLWLTFTDCELEARFHASMWEKNVAWSLGFAIFVLVNLLLLWRDPTGGSTAAIGVGLVTLTLTIAMHLLLPSWVGKGFEILTLAGHAVMAAVMGWHMLIVTGSPVASPDGKGQMALRNVCGIICLQACTALAHRVRHKTHVLIKTPIVMPINIILIHQILMLGGCYSHSVALVLSGAGVSIANTAMQAVLRHLESQDRARFVSTMNVES